LWGKQKEAGITLVALVVTVIILLILSGVAISMITGEGGLFARANHAGYRYNDVSYNEATRYNELDALMAQYIGDVDNGGGQTPNPTPTPSGLQDAITETPTTFSVQANATNITLSILPEHIGVAGTTYQYQINGGAWVNARLTTDTTHTFTGLSPETQYTVNVKIDGVAQTEQNVTTASQASMKDISTVADAIKYSATPILATDTTYSGTYKELTTTDGSVKVPVGFTVRYDSATTVNGGIVVADQNDNQWVWIPVNANQYVRTAFLSEILANVAPEEEDGETFYEAVPTGAEANVETVGGYYIGRYEAGSAEDTANVQMRDSESEIKTVTIKRDQVPYTYVGINSIEASSGCGNCTSLASNMSNINGYKQGITTKLCSSYAWDRALNFIGNDSWSTGTGTGYKSIRQHYGYEEPGLLSWDNPVLLYINDYDGEIEENYSTDNNPILTGQGDATKNIYDMGGNCWEYTSELIAYEAGKYVKRGGVCGCEFYEYPAGCRVDDTNGDWSYISFRVTLYL